MITFVCRRLLALVAVLYLVITITFFLIRIAPGGPFDRERKLPPSIEKQLLQKYRLDAPEARAAGELYARQAGFSAGNIKRAGEISSLGAQYFSYMGDLLHGDLRISTKYLNRSVNELIAQALPVSIQLGSLAFVIATVAGVAVGCIAAVWRQTWVDAGAMFMAVLAISIPTFVTGPLLILALALKLNWLPVGGSHTPSSWILPSITLAGPYVAYIARLMRASMLEVIGQDYVRTARAKGLPESRIICKHAAKVAILPVISFLGPLAANLLTGSIVVETIFNIPGAGGFFVNSIQNRDGFLLLGVVIVYCTLLVGLNLAVDIAYSMLDRRIRLY